MPAMTTSRRRLPSSATTMPTRAGIDFLRRIVTVRLGELGLARTVVADEFFGIERCGHGVVPTRMIPSDGVP